MRTIAWWVLLLGGPARAGEVTLPPQLTVFEDVDDGGSDEDLNDVVVRWSGQCDLNADGELVRVTWSLAAVAAGATLTSALEVTVPVSLPDAGVRIERGLAAPEDLSLLPGDPVVVWASFRDAFVGAGPGFVNTSPGTPTPAVTTFVTFTPSSPASYTSCPTPALQIRRALDGAVIGLGSTIGPSNRPLAARVDDGMQVATEKTALSDAYAPGFLAWAADIADGTCDTTCADPDDLWFDHPVPGLTVARPALATEAPLGAFDTCTDAVVDQDELLADCGDHHGVCRPCDACSALKFDGVNDYALMSTVNTGTALGAGTPWTVDGWVRVDAPPSGATNQELGMIVTPTCQYWGFSVNPDRRLSYYRWPTGCTGTTQLTLGEWHHFAFTGQRAAGTPYVLYLDGAVECSGTSTANEPAAMDNEWLLFGARSNLCLSEGNTPGAHIWFFDGALKDVRFSDTIRYTSAFVPDPAPSPDASTRVFYSFDEGIGAVADDSAGVSHDASISGATWVSSGPSCGP